MDVSKISLGEKVAAASALALLVIMFIPWYGVDSVGGFGVGDVGADVNAWEAFSFVDILLFLAIAIVVGLVLARAAGSVPELPWPPAQIIALVGGLAAVLILFRLIVTPGVDTGGVDIDVDLGRKIGVFLGLIAAAGMTYGGWTAMSEAPATTPSAPAGGSGPAPPSTPSGGQAPPSPPAGGQASPSAPAGDQAPPAPAAPPAGSEPPAPGGHTPAP